MKRYLLAIFIFFGIMLVLYSWYDEQLFTSTSTGQKPMLMLVIDTSPSMTQTIFYPKNGIDGDSGYDYGKAGGYSGTLDNSRWTNQTEEDGSYVSFFKLSTPGYIGFRITSTNSMNGATYKGSVTNIMSATRIKVPLSTYNSLSQNGWILGRTSGVLAKVSLKEKDPVSGNCFLNLSEISGSEPENNIEFIELEPLFCFPVLAEGEVLRALLLYGTIETGTVGSRHTRYTADYLKWIYGNYSATNVHATDIQRQRVAFFHKYGTFNTATPVADTPIYKDSNCNCSGQTNNLKVFTRMQAAREAMCKLAEDQSAKVFLGLARFEENNDNPAGAKILEPLNNMADSNSLVNFKKSIYLGCNAWGETPLAEALADVWFYFRPGGTNIWDNEAKGRNAWPVGWKYKSTATVNGITFTIGEKDSVRPASKTSPLDVRGNSCTNSYIALITDGESTKDNFSNDCYKYSVFRAKVKRTKDAVTPVYNWNPNDGWGDYDSKDPANATATYCTTPPCWLTDSNGTDYLDDVIYFMYNQDLFPDKLYENNKGVSEWPGQQNIVTHIIGFNTTNDMLLEAVDADHQKNEGKFFPDAGDYESLNKAFSDLIKEIELREEQMMYNVFASPKQAVTEKTDFYGFKGTFFPRNDKNFWEGHLKCYKLTEKGEFPGEAEIQWDAFSKLQAVTDISTRNIYTFKGSSDDLTNSTNNFNTTNILPTDLGYVNDDDDEYKIKRNNVVNFIRGDNGYGYKLGDIFHFNPIVVAAPLEWKAETDPSYKTFYDTNIDRKEVVYIGTNDGMLHCIQVQVGGDVTAGGNELWGFIPPSHLPRLKKLKEESALNLLQNVPPNCDPNPPTTSSPCNYDFDRYFVDGKGMVKDVRFWNATTSTYDWKTILIFGMGIGGRSYCALDVSDSDNPIFLWEFTDAYMGYSEARPIITDINDGTGTYPAVVIPGGYDYWEKPAVDGDETSYTGKGLYVLKIAPGASFTPQVVKKFIFTRGEAAGESSSGIPTRRIADFKYPFVAAPALFDKNRDGISDYIYACDTGDYRSGQDGGRIWKIPILGSPANWIPEKIFQMPYRQTMFLSPTLGYDKDWNLWVFVGTGRRSQITANDGGHICVDPITGDPILDPITGLTTTCYDFTNPNGMFYAFMDKPSSLPLDMTVDADIAKIKDITSFFTSMPTDDADKKIASGIVGISFTYNQKTPEVIFEPTPIFVGNTLLMNTYAPFPALTTETSEYSCNTSAGFSGNHFVYKFTLGSIGNSVAITAVDVFGAKILGSGVLSSGIYKVYYGADIVGTFTVGGSDEPPLDDLFGKILWKEDKK